MRQQRRADLRADSAADPRRTLAEGKYLRLVVADGWEYVERTNASGVVVIVPTTDDGRLVLAEQFRVPVQSNVIEFPAGLVGDVPGQVEESLAAAVRRELLEETGFEARDVRFMAQCTSSSGLSSEVISFFRAEGLRRVGPAQGDGNEQILVHEVPLGEIDRWLAERVADGVLVASMVYAGLHLLRGDGGARSATGAASDHLGEVP